MPVQGLRLSNVFIQTQDWVRFLSDSWLELEERVAAIKGLQHVHRLQVAWSGLAGFLCCLAQNKVSNTVITAIPTSPKMGPKYLRFLGSGGAAHTHDGAATTVGPTACEICILTLFNFAHRLTRSSC